MDLSHLLPPGDPRTEPWFVVKSPVPMATVILFYLYFCTKLGPQLMKNRTPFKMNRILMIYNIGQVCFSSYLVYEGLAAGWGKDYKWICEPIDYSDNPKAMRMAGAVWLYYMAKYIELLDTIFFVLRKKDNQISFLHLYHHSHMVFLTWFGTKYFPGGHGTFFGLINCFVHVIMYGYYCLAAMGPKIQKYLWWKKYLTTLQLVQFVAILIHSSFLHFYDCDYPKIVMKILLIDASFILVLFTSFYITTYVKKKSQ